MCAVQPVPSVSGHVDKAVLERMAKIMSYMRVSTGKPGKKPKKTKDKLAALHGIGHSQGTSFPVVHGTENIIPKAAGLLHKTLSMLGLCLCFKRCESRAPSFAAVHEFNRNGQVGSICWSALHSNDDFIFNHCNDGGYRQATRSDTRMSEAPTEPLAYNTQWESLAYEY